MPSVELKPRVADPVTLEDVERELYALTGWQKPQDVVDEVLDVVVRYAGAARRGVVPLARVMGHERVATSAEPCAREHLDEHVCATVAVAPLPATDGNAPCSAPAGCVVLEGCPRGCQVTRFEAAERARATVDTIVTELKPPEPELVPARVNSREPALTVEQLLTLDESQLRPAQRVARAVLLAGEQRCSDCGTVKPLDSFYRDSAKLTRRMGKCSDCSNAASAARRAVKGR